MTIDQLFNQSANATLAAHEAAGMQAAIVKELAQRLRVAEARLAELEKSAIPRDAPFTAEEKPSIRE